MKISVVLGDITELEVDAVVNAADSSLMGGGGVDGAIHARGGPSILEECRVLRHERFPDGLPPGEAVATGAGDLPAHWIIHTVGPVYQVTPGAPEVLAACHVNSLTVADPLGARSVAFPAISTGVYGYPVEEAAEIAVTSVLRTDSKVAEVLFALFDREALRIYGDALERHL